MSIVSSNTSAPKYWRAGDKWEICRLLVVGNVSKETSWSINQDVTKTFAVDVVEDRESLTVLAVQISQLISKIRSIVRKLRKSFGAKSETKY
jgi:hypothetical protein